MIPSPNTTLEAAASTAASATAGVAITRGGAASRTERGGRVRVKTYPLLVRAVEEGILGGLRKAEKREWLTIQHEAPAADEIHSYVMNAISEYFDWEDDL